MTLDGHGADEFRLGEAASGTSVEIPNLDEIVVQERRRQGDGVGVVRPYDFVIVITFFSYIIYDRGYCIVSVNMLYSPNYLASCILFTLKILVSVSR